MSLIQEIESVDELDQIVSNESRGVVVDVWGTWCQPCRALRPHIEELAAQHVDDWKVVAVHAESLPDLIDRYSVQSTPTLIYLHAGNEVHRSTGAVTPSTIATAMADHASVS